MSLGCGCSKLIYLWFWLDEAVAYHYEHETNNLDRSFGRSRQEGRSDVSIGRRHPELRPTLHIKDYETPYFLVDKILVAIAFLWPAVVDGLAVGARKSLDLLESLGMREGGGCGQNCAVIGICGV
jgi:hypothetical protein